MRIRLSALLLALFLLLPGCAARESGGDIAATTAPVAEFAQAITEGTGLTVTRLITDSVSCLHDYSLSVRQMEAVEESQVVLTVLRNGKEAEFCVNPQKTEDGSRLGAYVRDSVAGIGTVTYYDPNTGNFGALGHGVNDAETSILMPLEAGVVVRSTVSQVEKGKVAYIKAEQNERI